MVVGGISIMPFAERKFIYNKQENPIKSMGYGVYQTPKNFYIKGEKISYE